MLCFIGNVLAVCVAVVAVSATVTVATVIIIFVAIGLAWNFEFGSDQLPGQAGVGPVGHYVSDVVLYVGVIGM